MNELAQMIDMLDDCLVCPQPCVYPEDYDNDGNPIHEQCRIDREAMKADDRRE